MQGILRALIMANIFILTMHQLFKREIYGHKHYQY